MFRCVDCHQQDKRFSKHLSDDQERLAFLTHLTQKVNKPSSQDAYVYALVAASEVKLRLQGLDDARKDLDKAESILDTFDSVETEVHATFYKTNASYYQVRPSSHSKDYQMTKDFRPNLILQLTIEMHCSILHVSTLQLLPLKTRRHEPTILAWQH